MPSRNQCFAPEELDRFSNTCTNTAMVSSSRNVFKELASVA